jgi:chemotaxis protein MotB
MSQASARFSMQDREGIWLNTFVSLFIALLAFFILIANMIYLETSLPKRNFQKMQHDIYLQAVKAKQRMKLDWLDIEETVTKGTRLTLRAEQLKGKEVFRVGSDKISPERRILGSNCSM